MRAVELVRWDPDALERVAFARAIEICAPVPEGAMARLQILDESLDGRSRGAPVPRALEHTSYTFLVAAAPAFFPGRCIAGEGRTLVTLRLDEVFALVEADLPETREALRAVHRIVDTIHPYFARHMHLS
ncbi:MAG: hypothetical protein HYY06_06905 [Deltaproteobacteria bacterium]|nr:hypothetical protein [Deltaproteobacteria bacterium]